jgi:hypothetical protein
VGGPLHCAKRKAHNIHDFIMAQHAQHMGGMACEGMLNVRGANQCSAEEVGGQEGNVVGFAKAPLQGGPAAAIGELQWASRRPVCRCMQ